MQEHRISPRDWVTKNIDFKTLYFVINNYVSIIHTMQYNTIQYNILNLE